MRLCLLCCLTFTAFAAEAPLLDRLTVHSTGPVTISIPLAAPPQGPIYRATDGAWKPLAVTSAEGRATFTLPADGVGSTTIILNKPDWLILDDDAPPAIEQLIVDGKPVDVTREVDLGHRAQAPSSVMLFIADASPIDVAAARASLDGAPLQPGAIAAAPADGDLKRRTLVVALLPLPDGPHTVTIRIPDAAPIAHFAELTLRFMTGPLVKDGGFEQLNPDGAPSFWQLARWSEDATTSADLRVAEGGQGGGHCAELTGIAGPLNLIFAQRIPLTPGRKYVVRGVYQSTSPNAFVSIINDSQDENKQYDSLPPLPPAQAWTPFEFHFTTKPSAGYTLYLRNAGKGMVRWDDVGVEEEE